MSSEEDREPASHVQDVSRAWDSLLEAKHVLQGIENKVDIQNQRRNQAQKIRRRLQRERSSFPGPASYSSVINDSSHLERRPIYQRKPDETFTLHSEADFSSKMDIPLDLSSRTRPSPFLQQNKPSVASFDEYHLDNTHENKLAKSNQENFNNGRLTASRGYSEEHVNQVPKTSNLGLQTCNTGDVVEEMGIDYRAVTYPSSPTDIRPEIKGSLPRETITPTPSPMINLYEQKLEHLKRRSPKCKLEKLKERIQEQKKRQDLSKRNPTKSGQNTEILRKPPLKRKVCKVTFGPPVTCHKGLSAAEEKTAPVYSKEDTIKREKENLKKKSQKSEGDTAFRCSREKSKVLKSKSPVTRKLSFKSPSPERKGKHSDLYGPSAWREGQRRIQQILGPSPVTLMRHHSPKSDDLHALPKGSCRRCQKMGSPDSLICKQQPNIHELMKRRLDGAQVISESSAEEHRSRPSCKDREKARERSRSKSLSPKRPHAMYNHMEERVQCKSSKKRSCSVEQIRDFMKKKAIERQKMEQENQMKMKKALQTRKEQLDNVLKKQKEAFPPRREAISTTVSWKKTQIKPYDRRNEGRNLSEWLHVTSSDLLREDDAASGSHKKQKTRILPKDGHSSLLRLQDLVPVPTVSQDIQVKDSNFSKGLNDNDLPSHKTADVSSQCRTHQERLHAIWTTAKDLGRRVEQECSKLGSPKLSQCSGTSVSSPPPSQMMSTPGKYPVVVEPIAGQDDKNFQEYTRKPPEDKEHNLPTSADIGLYWTPGSPKVSTGPLKKKKEFTEGTFQTKTLHTNVHNEKAQKSGCVRRSASTSPHRRSDVSSPKHLRETSLSPPRRKPASPQKIASPPYSDKKGKRGKPQHAESSSPVKQKEIASKVRAQLQQQEKDLAALRLKADMEAKEAQRCLEEMLRCNKQRGPGLQTSSSEKQGNHYSCRQESEKHWFETRSEVFMESGKHGTGCVTQLNGPATTHASSAPTATESLERSWDHTEPATDSTSKWSEVGEFYGSPNMFARFTLEMSQQYIREEELRARHQTALLRLREEALKEKTKAELALLNHQKIYWKSKNEPIKMEELVSQELEIQRNLKEEQAEIRHLHNVYKAAHQERKLLLRQQKEILRIQQSAAHIQHKLHKSGVTPQVSELIDLDPSTQLARHRTFHESTLASEHLNQNTQSSISELSEDDDITEKTQPTETYQVQTAEDGSISPGPGVFDNSTLRSFPQSREVADEEEDYIPDGSAEGNALSGSPQNHLTSPFWSQEDQRNRSTARQRDRAHEENIPANQKELETTKNIQDLDRVTAGESRVSLSLEDDDKERERAEAECSEELRKDANIMSTTQEAANDDQLAIERTDDHNSQSISVPSKSKTRTLSPSLAEFQKVSAKLINISESSPSASDRGQAGEDTESGDSEVFDMESSEFPSRGPLDLACGENMMANGDKSNPTSSPTKPPDCRKPVILVMKETQSKTEMAPLACESFPTSEDLTESDTKTYGINHLPENQDGSVVRITNIHKSTSMSPKGDGNAAGMSSPDTKDRQGVTETNEKQSFTKSAIFRKIEMMPSHTTASKDLSQIKSFPHRSEGDDIFIMDEVLQPIEDTLSEILSPIDEKLSYESADLYSPQQDQSEELPSLPRDSSSIKSGDSDTEDFPTPPEEILLSRSESLQSSREASLIEEIYLLYDSLLTEDTLLPPDEINNAENSPLETENSRRLPEEIKPCRPFLTLSKAEDDIHDPLSTFEIGDRVLVKLSKPGTLMYKGLTSFKVGYWAGVALDKPEGDNDGTYEGIRYFECSKNCGVFVRPGQISHLLFDELDRSDPKKDEDDDYSFGDGPSPGHVQKHDESNGDPSGRQLGEKDEGKQSSEKGTNLSRSCSLKASENINDLLQTTISPRCFHAYPEGLLVDRKNPGQTLQIKQFCRGDINKLIAPNPSQDDKHRLLLKVTDELISRVLLDAIATCSKISAPEKVSLMNSSKDEKCMVAEEGFCNQLLSVTTRQAGGYVDTLVTEVINDCIEEYQQIRRKKGKENTHWSSLSYGSPFLVAGEDRTSSLIDFTDGIFEELLKDSLRVIENINGS
ncbi:coiled-coil domain-containing protein 187 isoform X2 [Eleutherodactylus coqui]|uniref:coiled-coil domain-containing protein 187 isoform X2 n=1 Tax=Eleutherodactylus coqui TaxID=57060 RepID=UPI003462C084